MPKTTITSANIAEVLALLVETPARIATATAVLTETQLHTPPSAKEWSIAQILAHLRGFDDVWTHTIYAMLTTENPHMPVFHPREWSKVVGYGRLPFTTSLQSFTLKRVELVVVLQKLPEEKWARPAMLGNHTHSVFSQARRLALHEATHWAEIETLAEQLQKM
ncbi:MAG: DinB family protein [Anaerolineae bacterium]|nr:DinB family protein [Anaerolineae bacterium]